MYVEIRLGLASAHLYQDEHSSSNSQVKLEGSQFNMSVNSTTESSRGGNSTAGELLKLLNLNLTLNLNLKLNYVFCCAMFVYLCIIVILSYLEKFQLYQFIYGLKPTNSAPFSVYAQCPIVSDSPDALHRSHPDVGHD